MNITQISGNLKKYIDTQLTAMSVNTPILALLKPVITRIINKNYNKINNSLMLIADEEGNIDVDGILTEVIASITSVNAFVLNTAFIGDIEIGNGSIKLNIPFTDKKIVFNKEDLEQFKQSITSI